MEPRKRFILILESFHLALQKIFLGGLNVAISRRLTFYDASYLVAAQAKHLTLVTDDEDLSKIAKEYVATERSGQI